MSNEEVKLDRNNGKTIFRRFFHIGPILTIFIIKSITIMTLYLNSMWFPAHSCFTAFLNQATFITLSALTSFNFVMTAIMGPSYLPLGWRPKNKNDEHQLQFCNLCNGFKAPRAHHCRKCQRCVVKMDHHCPYVANCVGHGNQSHFIWFLSFAVAGCTHAAVVLICSLYAGLYRDYYIYNREYRKATVTLTTWSLILTIFNIGLSVGVVIAVGMLLFFQLRAVFRNRTGIEDWILDKAIYRRRAMVRAAREAGDMSFQVKPFVYPYDFGRRRNAMQVLNFTCLPVGNGIEWPVVEGCDQYTLTREQIAQKAEKRARTKQYRIASKVSGSWFPLWSYGIRTACSPPLTDESRISLDVGDLINVTRWRKNWLFGEKVKAEATENGKSKEKEAEADEKKCVERVKGWFPRRAAVEMYDDDDNGDADDFDEAKESKKLK